MTEFQKGFLALIKSALTDSPLEYPVNLDYGEVYRIAEAQQVVPLVYYGAIKDPAFLSHSFAQIFLERTCVYVGHGEDQAETVNRIFQAFDKEGISYMPLKGTLLKSMYPSTEMRVMGDSDILIKMDEYERVQRVMLSLMMIPQKESDHEYNWKTMTGLQIELHKRLIPSYNEDYYAYYGDGWRLARPVEGEGCRYEMSPEDTFIYLFTHFAKHYRDQGAGLKYVIDFYVYQRRYPELDMAYIARELDKLQLFEFYQNVMGMVDVWFGGASSNEIIDYMTDKIFSDGVFGKEENGVMSEGVKLSKESGSVRAKRRWRLIFPRYSSMCARHPILKKWAILLPLFWIIRGFDIIFFHRDRYRSRMEQMELMTDENIDQYHRELNYVGLDYNFGEDDPPKEKK
jgi:hypothetical protein